LLSGLLIAVLVTLSGLGGAYLASSGPSARPTAAGEAEGDNPFGGAPSAGPPAPTEPAGPSTSVSAGPATTGRPADGLAGWAAPLAGKLNIPPVVMEAYGYAELVLAQQKPTCQLRWTTLAGIGKIESNHGQANATLRADGKSQPPILGPALDGQGARRQIADTDGGQLDHDTTWDRAVGPMQFIPSTWRSYAIDADRDGVSDPNDIDDAALAAGEYLCASGQDLSSATGWWAAVLAYNDVQVYAQDVFTAANDYGQRGR
jgi:hypothetical protein